MPYYVVQAGIGDKMHYQCTPTCKTPRATVRSARDILNRIRRGDPVRNANLSCSGGSFTRATCYPTWARIVYVDSGWVDPVIDAWRDCPASLELILDII